jgi:hypothetical protein
MDETVFIDPHLLKLDFQTSSVHATKPYLFLCRHRSFPDEVFNKLPSSPPLPPLPPPSVFPSRKRHAGWDHDSSMSSDPTFSEDASEESEATEYKRKRFCAQPFSPAMACVRGETREWCQAMIRQFDRQHWRQQPTYAESQSLTFGEYVQKGAPLTQQ